MEAPAQNSKGNVKGPLQYVCDECPLICQSLNVLRNHKRKHTGEKPCLCSICGKSFKRSCILDDHMRILHPEAVATDKLRLLKCSYCPKLCPNKSVLRYHERVHTGERPFKCGFCTKEFTFANNRNQHEVRVHKKVKTAPEPVCHRATLSCEICSRGFISQARLDVHLRIHAGKKPYQCDYCSEEFDHPSGKRMHEIRKHADQIPDFENVVKDMKCTWCGKIYAFKKPLIIHIRSHTGERPFICDVCGKSFPQKQILKSHAKTHEKYGLKPLKCRFCDDRFTEAEGMRRHEIKLHKIQPIPIASYKLLLRSAEPNSELGQMALASFVPSSIIPKFKCDKCKRNFLSRYTLKFHVCLGHAREKPFECEICQMKFYSYAQMQLHLEALGQHGIESEDHVTGKDAKQIRCFWCPQVFKNQSEADEHEKLHLPGEKKFKCYNCGLELSSQVDIARHCTSGCDIPHQKTNSVAKTSSSPRIHTNTNAEHVEIGYAESPDDDAVDVKQIRCFWCPQVFKNQSEVDEHEKLHLPGVKKFKCNNSGLDFSSQVDIARHCTSGCDIPHQKTNSVAKAGSAAGVHTQTNSEHTEADYGESPDIDAVDVKQIHCFWCSKVFESQSEADDHEKLHLPGETNLKCNQCDFVFSCPDALNKHCKTSCSKISRERTQVSKSDQDITQLNRRTNTRQVEPIRRQVNKSQKRKRNAVSKLEDEITDSESDEDFEGQFHSDFTEFAGVLRRSQRSCVKQKAAIIIDDTDESEESESEETNSPSGEDEIQCAPEILQQIPHKAETTKIAFMTNEDESKIQIQINVPELKEISTKDSTDEAHAKANHISPAIPSASNQTKIRSIPTILDGPNLRTRSSKHTSAKRRPLYRVHISQKNQIEELTIDSSDVETESEVGLDSD